MKQPKTTHPGPLEWGAYILRPTDPKYPSIYDIPNDCGIYGWWSREGDLLYVGRSLAMNSRLRSHHMPTFGGRQLTYRLVPERYLNGVEMAHIKTLEPYHNAARETANLPFWGEMCRAIASVWQGVHDEMYARISARESEIVQRMAAELQRPRKVSA